MSINTACEILHVQRGWLWPTGSRTFFFSQMGFPLPQLIFTDSSRPLPTPLWGVGDDVRDIILHLLFQSRDKDLTRTETKAKLTVKALTQPFRQEAWRRGLAASHYQSRIPTDFHLWNFCVIKVKGGTRVNICYYPAACLPHIAGTLNCFSVQSDSLLFLLCKQCGQLFTTVTHYRNME